MLPIIMALFQILFPIMAGSRSSSYYVDPASGSDANAGTSPSSPLLTLKPLLDGNYIGYSESMTNAAWAVANAAVASSSAVATPPGVGSLFHFTETAVTNIHTLESPTFILPGGQTSVTSVYAHAAERSQMSMYLIAGAQGTIGMHAGEMFNLTTGATGASQYPPSGFTIVSAAAVNVGNGWWRCSLVVSQTVGANQSAWVGIRTVSGGVESYAGTSGNGIYVTGAQVSWGSLFPYVSVPNAGPRYTFPSFATIGIKGSAGYRPAAYTAMTFINAQTLNGYLVASGDGITWATSGNLYATPTGLIRDPSVIKVSGTYWMVHTDNTTASGTIGLASSPDGVSWSYVALVSTGQGAVHDWAPEWFQDTDNSLHVLFSSDAIGGGNKAIYELHPTDSSMLNWSSSTLVFNKSSVVIDPFVEVIGGTYYLWYSQGGLGYATSSSLLGTYTDHGLLTALYYEGPSFMPMPGGGCRMYTFKSNSNILAYAQSNDCVTLGTINTVTSPTLAIDQCTPRLNFIP